MHYIIGTSFTVGQARQQGSRVVGVVEVSRNRGKTGPFQNGQTYTLYNIRPLGEDRKLEYTFYDTNKEMLVVEFNSSKEADGMISKATGESLPDYMAFYSNRSA